MHTLLSTCLLVLVIILESLQPQLTVPPVIVDSPQDGDVLQGIVSINASVDFNKVAAIRVYFGYASDKTETWFQISDKMPADDGVLATWDTSLISDGVYRLLIKVELMNGSDLEIIKTNLQVMNYTQKVTAQSGQEISGADMTPGLIASEGSTVDADQQVQTFYTSNPGYVSEWDWVISTLRGVGFSGLMILTIGLYLTIKHRHKA